MSTTADLATGSTRRVFIAYSYEESALFSHFTRDLVKALTSAGVKVFVDASTNNSTIGASGLSRRDLRELAVDELVTQVRRTSQWAGTRSVKSMPAPAGAVCVRLPGVDRFESEDSRPPLGWRATGSVELDLRGVRSEPTEQAVFEFLARLLELPVDPVVALERLLERLTRFGRRVDASRQSAVQRLRLACQALEASSDRCPGDVVVSSARMTRGPDFSTVTSVFSALAARGRMSALL